MIQAMVEAIYPFHYLVVFCVVQYLLINRLNSLEKKGFEGTEIGTLVMPYCSGIANIIFVYVVARSSLSGLAVIENCMVNNVTNLTFILGVTTFFYPITIVSRPPEAHHSLKQMMVNRQMVIKTKIDQVNLTGTAITLLFFTGVLWALSQDRVLDNMDGLVLLAMFLFFQVHQVLEARKKGLRINRVVITRKYLVANFIILAVLAYVSYLSLEHLTTWFSTFSQAHFNKNYLGWVSGVLMVIPNALLAVYYARNNKGEIAYSSQIGDCHICIPLCIALFSFYRDIRIPDFFNTGILILITAGAIHLLLIMIRGRLTRYVGFLLITGYAYFLYTGLI